MSPQLLSRAARIALDTRRLHAQVQRTYGDDGSRFPRDFYRPVARIIRGF